MADKCDSCKYEQFEDDKFCRQCGDEFQELNCDCGAEVEAEDNFCHQCGTGFEGVVEEGPGDEFQVPQPTPPQQPPSPQPPGF